MEDSFKHLEKDLESLVEASRELGIMVNDFKSPDAVFQNIKTIYKSLKDLDASKDNFKDVMVPMQVFSYIDEGKNPLLYTKDCLIETLKKNEEVKGKIVTFSNFHDLLTEEFKKSFPSEYEAYAKYREENPAQEGEEK